MGELIGTIIAFLLVCLIVAWVGWPVAAFAEAERLTIGQAALVFLGGSLGIFAVVATCSYLFTQDAATASQSARSGGSAFTSDGLIRGHAVSGHKVAAYETHRIAGSEFTFAFVPWPREKHRIYILTSPSYGSRATDAHSTHRYHDGALNRHFICVAASAYPDDLTAARELALMWAQATAEYIATGKKFG